MTTPVTPNIKTNNYDEFESHMESLSGMKRLLGEMFIVPFTFTTKDGITTGVNDHIAFSGKKVPLARPLSVIVNQPLEGTYMLRWHKWDDSNGYFMTFIPHP